MQIQEKEIARMHLNIEGILKVENSRSYTTLFIPP